MQLDPTQLIRRRYANYGVKSSKNLIRIVVQCILTFITYDFMCEHNASLVNGRYVQPCELEAKVIRYLL